MLSYIPETSIPHPRVRAVRKVAEDLVESSESQEESDVMPKLRKHKVRYFCQLGVNTMQYCHLTTAISL